MDPIAAALALGQMGIEIAQLLQSGAISDADAQKIFTDSGLNVDAAVAAWQTAKARWAVQP